MKKNLKIIIPAIVVVIVAIVGVLLVVNNNQQEQVKGTTTEVVKTTEEDKTTTMEEASETEAETSTETTEEVAEPTQSTTKTPETTKKPVTNSSGNSSSSNTTQKPTTTAPTTQKQETTTKKTNTTINVNVMGDEQYGDTARAGLYYDNDGKLTTYDKIEDGEWYWYYNEYGNRKRLQKPEKNPTTENPIYNEICKYCGKNIKDVNGKPACTAGGCSRWIKTLTCSDCGVEVPAHTCHTCKK